MDYFSGLAGHDKIKYHLQELLHKGTLPHSLLFYGEPSVGKSLMARALGSAIIGRPIFSNHGELTYLDFIKERRRDNEETEKQIEAEGLPVYVDEGDAFWLRPMKTGLKVEQWYILLSEYLYRSSDKPRVVIIDEFQTANAVMANAMLKTIEEPPAQVYFILVTSKKATVLPTIWSRCMAVPFLGVESKALVSWLKQKGYTEGVEEAVTLSQGNVGLALQYVQSGGVALLECALKTMEDIGGGRIFFTNSSLRLMKLSKEELVEVFQWLLVLARDLQALRYGAARELLQCPQYKDRLLELLPKWSGPALETVVEEILEAQGALTLNIRSSLVIDGLLISLRRAVKEDYR